MTKQEENYELRDLSWEIEAILFYRGIETSFEYLQKQTATKTKDILNALDLLEERLENSALILIKNENKFLLAVDSYNSKIIKKIKGHEEYGELSKSVLETLSIILYKSPISRFDIDNIRGINSTYALRNLMVRGLIEIKKDGLSTLYIPTVDTFSHLGIASKEFLPNLKEVVEKIDKIERELKEAKKTVFEK